MCVWYNFQHETRCSHSHWHKYLNLCDHTASTKLYWFIFAFSCMFGVAEQTYVTTSSTIVVSKSIGSQLHWSITTSVGIVITIIYTAAIPTAASLKYDCYIYIYLESRCRIAWWSPKSLFYPETQVLYSSCKHDVVSSRNCVILFYVHLTLRFIAR